MLEPLGRGPPAATLESVACNFLTGKAAPVERPPLPAGVIERFLTEPW